MKKIWSVLALLAIIISSTVGVSSTAVAQSGFNTYYIDYSSGNDSNAGTSASAPWQRHPYMIGFGGAYNHTSGDQFIFKGGVTWPSSCFPLVTGNGGTPSAPDYYGINSSWFAGSSFIKPIWDCAGKPLDTMYASTMVTLNYANTTLDSIVITNLNWARNGSSSNGNYGIFSGGANVVLTNVEIRNWYPVGNAAISNVDGLVLAAGSPGPQKVTHCIFDGRPTNSATAKGAFGTITEYCTYCYIVTGILGQCQYCQHNTFYNLEESVAGSTQHSAAISQFLLPNVTNYCNDNILSNCSWGELIYLTTISVDQDQTTTAIVSNNLVVNNTSIVGPCIMMDPEMDEKSGLGSTRGTVNICNNTLQSFIGNAYISVSSRSGSYWGVVNVTNNLFVGETNVGLLPDSGIPTVCNWGTNIIINNTSANADGYTLANSYLPASLAGPTLGAETLLSTLTMPGSSGASIGTGAAGKIAGGGIAAAMSAFVAGGAGSDIVSGLLVNYRCNQAAGSTVADSSGSGETGILTGNCAWTNGMAGTKALSFPDNNGTFGSSEGVSPSSISYTGDWTMTLWVNNSSYPGAANYAASTASGTGVFVGPGSWGFYDGTTPLNASASLASNAWYFLAVSKSAGTNYQLYLNGKADTSGVLANVNISALTIGNRGSSFLGMNGSFEDFRVFTRTLSANEIATLASNGPDDVAVTIPTLVSGLRVLTTAP